MDARGGMKTRGMKRRRGPLAPQGRTPRASTPGKQEAQLRQEAATAEAPGPHSRRERTKKPKTTAAPSHGSACAGSEATDLGQRRQDPSLAAGSSCGPGEGSQIQLDSLLHDTLMEPDEALEHEAVPVTIVEEVEPPSQDSILHGQVPSQDSIWSDVLAADEAADHGSQGGESHPSQGSLSHRAASQESVTEMLLRAHEEPLGSSQQ